MIHAMSFLTRLNLLFFLTPTISGVTHYPSSLSCNRSFELAAYDHTAIHGPGGTLGGLPSVKSPNRATERGVRPPYTAFFLAFLSSSHSSPKMSSNCPPQLQLSIQPSTTSFKRSFEQFGFDLGSPVDGGASGSNNGNDRNKRARSASSFSDSNESMDSSSSSRTLASTSSTPASSAQRQDGASLAGVGSIAGAGPLALGPPRLPTPDIQDVEMIDYPTESRNSVASIVSQHTHHQSEERFRLSLERFNAFDSQIAILRRSRPTSPLTGSAAPLPRSRLSTPPILPPLDIPGEQPRLSLASSAIPFLPPPPDLSTPLTEVLFGEEGEVEEEDSEEDETALAEPSHSDDDAEIVQEFQARLSSALERLRPQSPLVPGLSLEEHDEDREHMNDTAEAEDDDDEPGVLTPEPPTLPPIPSNANIVQFSLEDLLSRDVPDHSSSTVAEASNSSSLVSPTLGEHPLPSPILRDLHDWIDERQSSTESVSTSTPVPQNQPTLPPPATLPERVLMDHRLTAMLDNYESMDGMSNCFRLHTGNTHQIS
ncbi:hypothetical protein CPB83DRAFT_103185 [Crepidotus variabilis]|uniref:Uncharacterized protein n=1 Tax=Crepidotus variabilis TaxID=179855 RepID=A0A9P6EM67_9AGAR|nr:hypothetical protein CPB83DRAFT_103185 [Crepidotus variabilis]